MAMDNPTRDAIIAKGKKVFYEPETIPYYEVIVGTVVRNKEDTNCAWMAAVSESTTRSWQKRVLVFNGQKDKSGFKTPRDILCCYFTKEATKEKLRDGLECR
jgi:hypothetical protein